MKLKTLTARGRPAGRSRRRRSSRDPKARPVQPEAQHRVWSLLLPPGYSSDRR
jgi:hypothetical protein